MIFKGMVVAMLFGALIPSVAISGEETEASYLLGFQYRDNSHGDASGNGYKIKLQHALTSTYFTFAEFRVDTLQSEETTVTLQYANGQQETTDWTSKFRYQDFAIGLGGEWELGSGIYTTAQFMVMNSNTSITYGDSCAGCERYSDRANGGALRIGMRGNVTQWLELYGDLTHYQLWLLDETQYYGYELGDMSVEGGARFMVFEHAWFSIGYSDQGPFESMNVGFHFPF